MTVDDAGDLYGLPLDQFVAERGALAKRLRSDGRRDDAGAVAALRKPSLAAWAVNQLARTQSRSLRELFAAGDALTRAQAELLEGRADPSELRAAAGRERETVQELIEAARGLLSSGGFELTAATIERVSDTLHAAALEADARAAVSGGRLERELRHVGLGGGDGSTAAPARTPGPKRERGTAPKRGRDDQSTRAQRKHDEREQEQREQEQRLRAARREATAAHKAADRARRDLDDAQRARDRAAEDLQRAEGELQTAQARADEATRAESAAQESAAAAEKRF